MIFSIVTLRKTASSVCALGSALGHDRQREARSKRGLIFGRRDIVRRARALNDKLLRNQLSTHATGSLSLKEWYDREAPQQVHFWLQELEEHGLKALGKASEKLAANETRLQKKKLMPFIKQLCRGPGKPYNTHATFFLRASSESQPSRKPNGALALRTKSTSVGISARDAVAVFDFKAGSRTFTDTNRTQVLNYCHCILAVEQPDRDHVSGFLLNAKYVQFLQAKVKRASDGSHYEYEYTEPYQVTRNKKERGMPEGIRLLYSFCFTGGESHGFKVVNNPFVLGGYTHGTLLGKGALADVYSVDGKDSIIKLYRKIGEAKAEAMVLTKLKGLQLMYVPRLEKEDKRGLSCLCGLPIYKQANSA